MVPGLLTWRVLPNVALSVEISYPAGAVRVTGPASPLPFTVKDCDPEAVSAAVLKLPSELAEGETDGRTTVPDSAMVWVCAPELVSVMLPLTEPVGAVGERRV